jgi:hypothetical protein
LAGAALLAVSLGPAAAQNSNTTVQDGRVCINRTQQLGDVNHNTTDQYCRININRTVQLDQGGGNRGGTARRAGVKPDGHEPGRGEGDNRAQQRRRRPLHRRGLVQTGADRDRRPHFQAR